MAARHKSRVIFPKNKWHHFIVLIGLYLFGLGLVLLLKPSYFANILIVYLPGMTYNYFLLKRSGPKILLFGLCSLLFIVPVEILARLTNSWDVQSIFPRILGIAPIENVLYALVNIMYPLLFYEYFYDQDRNRKISPRWKVLVLGYIVLFAGTFTVFFTSAAALQLQYWMLGVIILIPIVILLFIYKRHILKRLLVPALVFGTMFALHELVSMYLGHWWWPGTYLLPIQILGFTYPLDDVIIWLLFSNMAVIAGYEVMWD